MKRRAWLTPDTNPATCKCRRVRVPNDLGFLMAVNGALAPLTTADNWEQAGTLTPEEAAAAMLTMFIEYLDTGGCMVGVIFPYLTAAPPQDAVALDGATLSDAAQHYPALWAVIDPVYKSGNDILLPDLRDKFLLSAGTLHAAATSGGTERVALNVSELPAHSHTYQGVLPNVDVEPPVGVPDLAAGIDLLPHYTSTVGGGASHENMPPYYVVRYAIWVR